MWDTNTERSRFHSVNGQLIIYYEPNCSEDALKEEQINNLNKQMTPNSSMTISGIIPNMKDVNLL